MKQMFPTCLLLTNASLINHNLWSRMEYKKKARDFIHLSKRCTLPLFDVK